MTEKQATKKCPYCGEEILANAIKCKHCGSLLVQPRKFYRHAFGIGKPTIFCPKCGYEGSPTLARRGSTLINILLLILGFFPGVLYWIRRGNYYYACPKCGNDLLVHIKEVKNIRGENK